MGNPVHVNHFILNPKEYGGQRVVTFKDIDAVHGRAEGTARKRFHENRERFIEGVDYFVRKTDEAKKEFGITAPNGLIVLAETGYLMLVKSFTDDLAWTVQRELVNNYFRIRQEKIEQPKIKRKEVVDIPQNPEFQSAFADIKKMLAAVDVTVQQIDCYTSEEDALIRMRVASRIAFHLADEVAGLARMKRILIPEPY